MDISASTPNWNKNESARSSNKLKSLSKAWVANKTSIRNFVFWIFSSYGFFLGQTQSTQIKCSLQILQPVKGQTIHKIASYWPFELWFFFSFIICIHNLKLETVVITTLKTMIHMKDNSIWAYNYLMSCTQIGGGSEDNLPVCKFFIFASSLNQMICKHMNGT